MSTFEKKDDEMILSEAIRLVGERLEVTFPVNGRSMRPFIEGGRDSVVLVSPDHVMPMDVVLAYTEDGRYVIHRVMKIMGDRAILMGDGNLVGCETCECKKIYAKVTYVVTPNGKKWPLKAPFINFVQKMWVRALPLRRYLLKLYRVYNRIRGF